MKVLFVGSEPNTVAKVDVAVRLRWVDARILVAAEPERGLELVELEQPDVLLYCCSDPGPSPVEKFIQALRAFSDIPLVVMEREGGGEYMEEVKALESGADDYIHHTAGVVDLVARLVAILRRAHGSLVQNEGQPLSSGPLSLDPATYEVALNGSRLSLTATEFKVLHLLLKNRGNVVTHDFLARSLWGDQTESAGLMKKYVQRLRSKLEDDPQEPRWIASVYGVGYRFLGGHSQVSERTMSA